MSNATAARKKRLTLAIIVAVLALVATTLLIVGLAQRASEPASSTGAPAAKAPPPSSPPAVVVAEKTVRLRALATCTSRACNQQDPCCNSCGHDSWVVQGSGIEARAKHGRLPRCSVDGCGGCAWRLEATGHPEGGAFVVVRWRKVGQ